MSDKKCLFCHLPLSGKQRNYCSDAHRKAYERAQERLENLQPQAKNGLNPDYSRIPDVDLSGLPSVFSDYELRDFAAHILAMADYEHVWCERTLDDLSRVPGQRHINDPIPPEQRRIAMALQKYQKSEAIFRWIADQVIKAIGEEIKSYRSPCYYGQEAQFINGELVTDLTKGYNREF